MLLWSSLLHQSVWLSSDSTRVNMTQHHFHHYYYFKNNFRASSSSACRNLSLCGTTIIIITPAAVFINVTSLIVSPYKNIPSSVVLRNSRIHHINTVKKRSFFSFAKSYLLSIVSTLKTTWYHTDTNPNERSLSSQIHSLTHPLLATNIMFSWLEFKQINFPSIKAGFTMSR